MNLLLSNIVFLNTSSVFRLKFTCTAAQTFPNVTVPNVPAGTQAVFANIYAFQSNRQDWMAHSFGRNASHDANVNGTAIYNNPAPYYNDVLVRTLLLPVVHAHHQ